MSGIPLSILPRSGHSCTTRNCPAPGCQATNPDLVSIPSGINPILYLLDLTIPGAGTALLGKEGAMACTVAVEESIAHHYNNQIRTLMEKEPEKYEELLQVSDHALEGTAGGKGRYTVW